MNLSRRTAAIALTLLTAVPFLAAQSAPDPTGHWEGALEIPNSSINVEVDLARNSNGEFIGTLTIPSQKVKGLPLTAITSDGTAIGFRLGKQEGNRAYKGVLAADGTTLSGEFTQDGFVIPFSLTRKGDAKIEPPARSAAIGKEMEGTWNGSLSVEGKTMRLVLIMLNLPEGKSMGTLANLDQGAVEVPIGTIAQHGANLRLDVVAVGGTYVGSLSANGTELVGTWTQGRLVAPATFTRAAADTKK